MGYKPDTQEDAKRSVRAASTADVTIASPGSTIDGVTMASGDRVLLKDQSTGADNGIYSWNGAATPMTRTRDADQTAEITAGLLIMVEEGTVNHDHTFVLVTNNPITIGSTSLSFRLENDSFGTLANRPAATAVNPGAQYFATDTVAFFISDGSNWIRISESAGTESGFAGIGSTAPAGKVFQDGTAISRTGANADLFAAMTIARSGTKNATAVITGLGVTADLQTGMKVEGTGVTNGTTINSIDSSSQITLSASVSGSGSVALTFFSHGNGDGSTTFNVPDRQGRGLVGFGTHADVNKYHTNDGLILASRTPKHAHTSAAHTHTMANHTHTSAAHTHTMASHTHTSAAHTHTINSGLGHTHTGPSHQHNLAGGSATAHSHGHSTLHSHNVNGHLHGLNAGGTGANTNGSSNTTTGGTATRSASPHTHGLTGTTDSGSSTTDSQSAGGSDNNTAGITDLAGTGATGSTILSADSATPGATGGPSTNTTDSTTPGVTGAPSTNTSDSTTPADTGSAGQAYGVTRWMIKL